MKTIKISRGRTALTAGLLALTTMIGTGGAALALPYNDEPSEPAPQHRATVVTCAPLTKSLDLPPFGRGCDVNDGNGIKKIVARSLVANVWQDRVLYSSACTPSLVKTNVRVHPIYLSESLYVEDCTGSKAGPF